MAFFNEFPHTRTYDNDLGWIISHFKELIETVEDLTDWQSTHETEYETLKGYYDDLIAGNFSDELIEALTTWMEENAIDLVGELVTHVFFGLTESGYFTAYIPESWEDIEFSTSGYDTTVDDTDFGQLILSY